MPSNLFNETNECSCSIRNSIVVELIKKVSPNRRVSTFLESIHVNMTLLITEILLRRLILSPKKFGYNRKKWEVASTSKPQLQRALMKSKKLYLNL